MYFRHLLHIIRTLKKHVPCPKCAAHMKNEHIEILDLYEDEAFVVGYCPTCDIGIEITVALKDQEPHFTKNYIDGASQRTFVTEEDIKGISTRLNEYKGNMQDLF